jgi:hypothetical protein
MAVALAMSAMPASGDVVIFIAGPVLAAPGSSGNTIEVDVQNTGAPILIAGFDFEIAANSVVDFTGANFSTSALYVFSGDSFDQAYSQPLNTSTGISLSAGDISNSGAGVTLGTGQTLGLAQVTFDVSPAAALGLVTVSFSADASNTNLSNPDGDSIAIDSLLGGTIDVAVPEPSTAAMLLAALMALGAWRPIGATLRSAGRMRR